MSDRATNVGTKLTNVAGTPINPATEDRQDDDVLLQVEQTGIQGEIADN